MTTEFYLVRHAESEINIETTNQIAGQCNWAGITENGVKQSTKLGLKLRGSGNFNAIYSSTAARAQQTARHCISAMGIDIRVEDCIQLDPRLLEINPGDFCGKVRSEIYSRSDVRHALDSDPWNFIPGDDIKGESQSTVAVRMRSWFDEVASKHTHGRILAFAHGGALNIFLTEVLQTNKLEAFKFPIDNTSVTVVRFNDEKISLVSRNDTSHLEDGSEIEGEKPERHADEGSRFGRRFANVRELANSNTLVDYLQNPIRGDLLPVESVLKCALDCAHQGGEMICSALSNRKISKSGAHDTKMSAADLLTETDIAVETFIRSKILSTFPSHLFVGEEGTGGGGPLEDRDRDGRFVWIVDPIDGTTNFVHCFPVVAVSIGLAYGDELIMGVVFNPVTAELWFSWKGCGAWMKQNDGEVVQISTSGCERRGCALVSTGFGVTLFRRETGKIEAQQKLRTLIEHNTWTVSTSCRDLRRIGSAACDICFVAMGRTDVFYEFGIREWDIAASLVILHESGGTSSTVGGVKQYSIRGRNVLVAASESLREELTALLWDRDVVNIIEEIEK